ncbi:hypothetical protein PLANPX_4204 [Lacipirellula parvula]|uniref:HNH endonuclease 5 domain-containing protein n=1 Tax=Lacipirellula parvula TaxID=2650471 RepID=A0A5K7XF15_9BACT|nr:hypothetical protein PLANPX_4204 [Lacipirellula parvula]
MARGKKGKRAEICVYCDRVAVTRDHVPPKAIFPKPHPSTLVSVPCCRACNQAFSADDQYFSVTVPTRHDVEGNEGALQVMQTGLRGLFRPEAKGFRTAILSRLETVNLVTPSGIFLGEGLRTEVDYERLDRVVRRTVRGLYFREYHARLPKTTQISAMIDSSFNEAEVAARNGRDRVVDWLRECPPRVIQAGVFHYWHRLDNDSPENGAWLLVFYDRVWYLVTTASSERKQ